MSVTPATLTPYRSIVDALLILIRGNDVLLAQRQGTGYADGDWNLPSGKLEDGETVLQAALREGLEEIGIHATESDLGFIHLIHYRNARSDARIGVFFQVRDWQGEPYNAEPHKCAQIKWWPLDGLPDNTYPYTVAGIRAHQRGTSFSVVGWDRPNVQGHLSGAGGQT
jgi:8-oxo-dGTP diphosphatase